MHWPGIEPGPPAKKLFKNQSLSNLRNKITPVQLPLEENPEEGDLFEGDIAGIDLEKGALQIPTSSYGKWPNGVVPYEIDPIFPQASIDTILSGIKMLEDSTRGNSKHYCIKLVPRTTEETYIRVINGSGCWSYVGKQNRPGIQQLSLRSPGCMVNAIVAHEFIHALGFFHEQSRPDRDQYVTIMLDNIQNGTQHNFNKYNTNQIGLLNFKYDYESVMHYGPKSFSKNGEPTIVPKDPNSFIGQRKYISETDIAEIRAFYEFNLTYVERNVSLSNKQVLSISTLIYTFALFILVSVTFYAILKKRLWKIGRKKLKIKKCNIDYGFDKSNIVQFNIESLYKNNQFLMGDLLDVPDDKIVHSNKKLYSIPKDKDVKKEYEIVGYEIALSNEFDVNKKKDEKISKEIDFNSMQDDESLREESRIENFEIKVTLNVNESLT
ncbi:unnamed protein product [Brachionus calyciflorus]|uniref:Metalloendopeptidase n=1 Tax=Brachionus calyciflorus TaxID=104777 RepID=A0A814GNI7_9BILA|nr:unnamed protein product [Brachionus calyciflorus]